MTKEKLQEFLSEKEENTLKHTETQWQEVGVSGMERKGNSEVI